MDEAGVASLLKNKVLSINQQISCVHCIITTRNELCHGCCCSNS